MANRTIRERDNTGRPRLTSEQMWRVTTPAAAQARVPVTPNGGAP